MTDLHERLNHRVNRHAMILALIVCCIVGVAGFTILLRLKGDMNSLSLSWMDDGLKVYSSKDGPFVVTHLCQSWSGSQESSVACLPQPVTIIDSRGHFFTREELHALTWIGASGGTNSPPILGTDLKAFYWVPRQTDRTSEHDIFRKKELR